MQQLVERDWGLRIASWAAVGLSASGFVLPEVGVFTSPVLAAWVVGVQRPVRGALTLAAITFGLSFTLGWRHWWTTAVGLWPPHLASLALGLLPFLAYRMVGPKRRPIVAGVALPAFAALTAAIGWRVLSADAFAIGFAEPRLTAPLDALGPQGAGPLFGAYIPSAIAGVLLALWGHEARAKDWPKALVAIVGGFAAPVAWLAAPVLGVASTPELFEVGCVVVAGSALVWALIAWLRPAPRLDPATVEILRSPRRLEALTQVLGGLTTVSGEHFPIRSGIARFVSPVDLVDSNGKLNRLYAWVADFYDDIQRVYFGLAGLRRDAAMRGYLDRLEIRPGDKVLETSIGTGANFRLLPRKIERFGLDLSADMLRACQANFGRWGMKATLVQGAAEALPFADAAFDVVFHVGGVNFFNDRAGAIAEMIRVARPGSLILIADETEKHVRKVYEAVPGERNYFKGRKGEVSAPVDLIPPEMLDVKLTILRGDEFYVLTFRKPR